MTLLNKNPTCLTAYSSDERDNDNDNLRKQSKKNSFSKKFDISVEEVDGETIKIMSADEDDEHVATGTEPLVSEPVTPVSPEKIHSQFVIEEISESTRLGKIIESDDEIENSVETGRLEKMTIEGISIRKEFSSIRTFDNGDKNGSEMINGGREMGSKKISPKSEISEAEEGFPKRTASNLDESSSDAAPIDSNSKTSEDAIEASAKLPDKTCVSTGDIKPTGSLSDNAFDGDDLVESLLRKSKEQRASLSQIIQKNQDSEEVKPQGNFFEILYSR